MQLNKNWIRQQRDQRAWSQEHLAEASGLGLRTIQRIESAGIASPESARALASAFNVPLQQFVVEKKPQKVQGRLSRVTIVIALLASSLTATHLTRTAIAEQIELAIGVSIDGTALIQQSVVAGEGKDTALDFGNEIRTVITPESIEIAGKQKLALSMNIFEVNSSGDQTLIESPEFLFEEDSSFEINIHGTPSGKSYRFVVRPQS